MEVLILGTLIHGFCYFLQVIKQVRDGLFKKINKRQKLTASGFLDCPRISSRSSLERK